MTIPYLNSYISDFEKDTRTIDPKRENWYSLTFGWALGKGMSEKLAHEFANHIRYKTKLG